MLAYVQKGYVLDRRKEGWFSGCRVDCFKWFEGDKWYFNIQYFMPGSSLCKPPAFDRSVFITDNEIGRNVIFNCTESLVDYVKRLDIDQSKEVLLTFYH